MHDQQQVASNPISNDTLNEPYQSAQSWTMTRYLCAAAHFDREFRDYVFNAIVNEEHRAISQVTDVDLVTVVKHCFAARRRETIRNVVLVLLFLLFLVGFPFLLIILANKFWALYFAALCIMLIWLTVCIELWRCNFTTILGRLTRGKFDPDDINVQLDRQLEQKLKDVQTANVVIYRNTSDGKLFEEPFIIGSGFAYKKWPSLKVDITKGKRVLDKVSPPKRFQLKELYDHLTRRLKDLQMNEMTITDKFYVRGQSIRDDKRFLREPFARPCLHIGDAETPKLVEAPHNSSERVRHYKCIQLRLPLTLLVMSVFIKFSIIGPHLDTEVSFYLLPPITPR